MRSQKNDSVQTPPTYVANRPSSSIFGIYKHSTSEIEKIPLSQSFLKFKDEFTERKYFEALIYSNDSIRSPSKEFKESLLSFLTYFSLYFLSTLIYNIVQYTENSMPASFLLLKLVFLGITATTSYIVLYLLLKSSKILKHCIKMILILGIVIIINLILSDDRVLAKLLGKNFTSHSINSLIILTFIYYFQHLLFDSFRYLLFLSFTAILFLTFSLVLSNPSDIYSVTYEIFVFSLFLILFCINCYRFEHVSKDLF